MTEQDDALGPLLAIVERIALDGDLTAVQPLLEMAGASSVSPQLAAFAEAFSRMVVQLEAREFRLECMIDELEQAKRELELANHDPLTQLPNRVIFRDRLRQALALAERTGGALAVLYLDLDRFKAVNDNLGHEAGDELLRQVATRLKGCLRETDTLARVGGDEFVCVLPQIESPQVAQEIAERFLQCLTQDFTLRAGSASVGTSIGIALSPLHGKDMDGLVQGADRAMYASKHAGRSRYTVCSA